MGPIKYNGKLHVKRCCALGNSHQIAQVLMEATKQPISPVIEYLQLPLIFLVTEFVMT